MSTARKGFYYKRLRAAGVEFERHYREYSTDELEDAHRVAVSNGLVAEPTAQELEELERRIHAPKSRRSQPPAYPPPPPAYPPQPQAADPGPAPRPADDPEERADPRQPPAPAPVSSNRPLDEMAGTRQNTKTPDEVIRVDERGRQWLQEEVRKPAYPKPRGRRVLNYSDPGTITETVRAGEYTETFEIAGDPKNATPAQVKITLPSYQVGMYRDPRYPFKVVCYNGVEGFDRQEVEKFYGGAELVDPICKRIYVENVLCYDMRSVIRAITTEYRQQRLAGAIT